MAKLLPRSCIVIFLLFSTFFNFHSLSSSSSSPPPLVGALNLTLPHQHPYPEHVVEEFHRRVNVSLTRRQTLEIAQGNDHISCVTGNPIDDCWRCDPNWANNRQQLADCAIGFGQNAFGGKGGPIYVVTSSSDPNPDNPRPGTLRDAVSQPGPVWIVFAGNMVIKLKRPLMVTSFKTIDGRGAQVEITGGGCISIEHMTNVIIHSINIHDCHPANSDGDGLHIFASSNIWVDHCSLSNCADGLIDCTEASTAITISNCYFSNHDKVMLLGHSDDYSADRGMQITVAFNRFGEKLVQRMPRCRFGYFHVVNNDYTTWGEYAVGGSSHPTVNSQGNRYIAPINRNAKEVTKRLDTKGSEWKRWNWRSEGDEMENGAFFVTSGGGVAQYSLASSVEPKSAAFIDQLTLNAGVLLANGGTGVYLATPGSTSAGISSGGGLFPDGGYSPPEFGGGEGGSFGGEGGLNFSNAPPPQPYQITFIFSTLIIFHFYFSQSHHYPIL